MGEKVKGENEELTMRRADYEKYYYYYYFYGPLVTIGHGRTGLDELRSHWTILCV